MASFIFWELKIVGIGANDDEMKQIATLLMAWFMVSGICFGQMDREIIAKLEKDAAVKGVMDAKTDFALGVYQIEEYGMFSGAMGAAEKYLLERYGVKIKSVAGCIISGMITNHAQTYNETMKQLLNKKFDNDIFEEAKIFAKDYAFAARQAKDDFARGIYQIERYGERADGIDKEFPEEKYLLEVYNVKTRRIGGITVALINHAKGYNETMQELLNKKHGKDIFNEAMDFAKQQNSR